MTRFNGLVLFKVPSFLKSDSEVCQQGLGSANDEDRSTEALVAAAPAEDAGVVAGSHDILCGWQL